MSIKEHGQFHCTLLKPANCGRAAARITGKFTKEKQKFLLRGRLSKAYFLLLKEADLFMHCLSKDPPTAGIIMRYDPCSLLKRIIGNDNIIFVKARNLDKEHRIKQQSMFNIMKPKEPLSIQVC